ncbi:MAG: aldehyde dehydrogenase family protein [Halobacteria archaeon]|nr:aldehyde dehydrogenase family protein [Halobacteria archaeon]
MHEFPSMSSREKHQHQILSENPATLEENDETPETSREEVERAVEEARRAQVEWGERSVEERLNVLKEFKHNLIENRREIARTVNSEVGKPFGEAIVVDIIPVVDAVDFVAREGPRIVEHEIEINNLMMMDRTSKAVREPLGVIGIISPWNYPFGIPASQIVYGLFAGNAVVLKPAEQTTLTGLKIKEMFDGTGLPDDVLKVVPGRGNVTGDALVNSSIDQMTFTGSETVGDMVHSQCAPRGIPTTLELGGSDPAVVLEDANLELTTDGVVWSRFTNCGQTCAAAKRLYVHNSIFEDVRDEIVRKVEALRVGDGADDGVDVGPLISEEALEKIHRQVTESVEMGATVVTGGEPLDGDLDGHFYEPTVLEDVTHDMPVVREETFGPVLPIMGFEDEDEAVELANDSRYGLSASVWTRDVDRGEGIARRLEAGTVTINDHTHTYGLNETPWGGCKQSGHGRTHGKWGIEEVTRLKHIHRGSGDTVPASTRMRPIWWFPYPDDYAEKMGDGIEFLYGKGVKKIKKAPQVVRNLLNQDTF